MKSLFETKKASVRLGALVAVALLAIALMGAFVGCSQGASSTSAASSEGTISVNLKVDATDYGSGILYDDDIAIEEGKTIYDALLASGLDLDVGSMSGTVYIDGIGGIVASKVASTSGWLFTVNGETSNVGVDAYTLKDGDKIVFTFYKDAMSHM